MKGIRFGEGLKPVPLAAAYNTTSTASSFVDVKNSHWLTFGVNWGAVDTAVTITVEECTSNSTSGGATEVAIPFRYRLSGAIGSDSWGAITTSDSSGLALVASTNDNQMMLIDIDPSALDDGYNYVRVKVGTASNGTLPLTVTAFLEPRYPQFNQVSSS